MGENKAELLGMLNRALELERAAKIQYLTHAELIKGPQAEKIIERIQEIASDEGKHEDVFRNLISGYLGAEPTMGVGKTHKADSLKDILDVNLKDEKDAVDFYKEIYDKLIDQKDVFAMQFETLEHDIRHVIIDEQEHITELSLLIGMESA